MAVNGLNVWPTSFLSSCMAASSNIDQTPSRSLSAACGGEGWGEVVGVTNMVRVER
jgi:hypothetical protein